MGADIHVKIFVRQKSKVTKEYTWSELLAPSWRDTGIEDRNYHLFSILASVRAGGHDRMYLPEGLPPQVSEESCAGMDHSIHHFHPSQFLREARTLTSEDMAVALEWFGTLMGVVAENYPTKRSKNICVVIGFDS